MKYLYLLIFSVGSVGLLSAQDLIVMRTEGEIIAKVLDIGKNHILYNNFGDPDSSPLKIAKSKVEMIIFEDGMKQYFALQPVSFESLTSKIDTSDMEALYQQGVEDAKAYYNKNGPFWGTFAVTLLFPLSGIVSGAVTGVVLVAIPPNIDVSDVPDANKFQVYEEYAKGYRMQAYKNRIGKVLKGFGLGLAIQIVVIVAIVSSW